MNKKGVAEWYWIIIGIIIVIIVAVFILSMFTEFGAGIRNSFSDLLGLTDVSKIAN